jgi:DNA polymerase-1
MEKKRLVIIDGHALIHRAYHALPPLTTKEGKLVNAVYGFLLVFLKAIKELQPDFVVATFDLPAPTFRDKIYKEYKATRPKAPDELCQQIPEVKRILKAFGIEIFEKEGFEADDIIGTIAKLAQRKQIYPPIETIIITGDLDTLQLVDSQTKVYTLKKGVKETILYDKDSVKTRYQLEPEQLPDFRALKGDPSDNIPGVPGIGEKTASQLIKEFGSLENLYQNLEKDTEKAKKIPEKVREKLRNFKEQAFFSKILSEIKKDVPIDFDLNACQLKGYDKEKVKKILEEFEFHSLINRLPQVFEKKEEQNSDPNSQQQKLANF